MDLRKQLHDVLYARVLFTLAVLTAVLWVQVADHGFKAAELAVALVVLVAANAPFLVLARRVAAQPLAAATVAVDIALVTAGVVFSGGALSAVAVYYVWPIVFASVFLSAWVPYAAAVASGCAYAGVWLLQAAGSINPTAMVDEAVLPTNWMLITVSLYAAAFLLTALLAGRLAATLARR